MMRANPGAVESDLFGGDRHLDLIVQRGGGVGGAGAGDVVPVSEIQEAEFFGRLSHAHPNPSKLKGIPVGCVICVGGAASLCFTTVNDLHL